MMASIVEGGLHGKGFRFALVVSRFNELVTSRLVEGARSALLRHGVAAEDIDVAWVPGAFEIPLVTKRLARSGHYAAILCLGAVIRGDTPHFDYIAAAASQGIARIGLETEVPTVFGVLTTDTLEQAMDRAGGKMGNKGADAAVTALEMVNLLRNLDTL